MSLPVKGTRDYTTWPSAFVSIAEDAALVAIVVVIAKALTGRIW